MQGRITVVGGSGFLGRTLVRRLRAAGAGVRVVARHPPASAPGMETLAADVTADLVAVADIVAGSWAVVNLAGTTTAPSAAAFYRLHCEAAARLAEAAARAGVVRFIQCSAMGADAEAPSLADRSKAAGERAVHSAFPTADVVRPGLLYGPGDHFFGRFGALLRRAPVVPLIGGGRTRFQPLHVEDAAEVLLRVLQRADAGGRPWGLGGSEIWTFRELLEGLAEALHRRPRFLSLPFPVAAALAAVTGRLPSPPLTPDQVRLLRTDKVIAASERKPRTLGLVPVRLADYLGTLSGGSR